MSIDHNIVTEGDLFQAVCIKILIFKRKPIKVKAIHRIIADFLCEQRTQ